MDQLLKLQHALSSNEETLAEPEATELPKFLPVARDPELIADFVFESREHLSHD